MSEHGHWIIQRRRLVRRDGLLGRRGRMIEEEYTGSRTLFCKEVGRHTCIYRIGHCELLEAEKMFCQD
jgi:hypothetical protein